MALTGAHTTADGVEHPTTYARIIEANLNFADWYGRIVVGLWHDKASYDAGRQMIGQCAIDLTSHGTQEERQRPGGARHPQRQPLPPAKTLLEPLKQTFGGEIYQFLKTRLDVDGVDFTQWSDV